MRRIVMLVSLALAAPLASGCFVVAAGAGAGAAIAYTNRGASANVPGTVDAVFDRAVSTFSALSIAETGRSTEESGATRRLTGKSGDQEITVEIKRSSSDVSAVEVVAKRNLVDYDKPRAKELLDRIVSAK